MEPVTQVSILWLSLKWLVAALVLGAEWSRVWEIPLVLTTLALHKGRVVQGPGSY